MFKVMWIIMIVIYFNSSKACYVSERQHEGSLLGQASIFVNMDSDNLDRLNNYQYIYKNLTSKNIEQLLDITEYLPEDEE